MKRYFIAGFLVLGLLLFGCLGGGQPSGTGNGTQGTPDGGANVSPNNGTPAGGTQDNGLSLAGLGYEQLIALGVPVECTVTDSEQGTETQMNVKMRGSRMRGEGTITTNGVAVPTTFITDGTTVYTRMPADQASLLPSCDWLKITTNASATASGGVETNPTEGLQSSNAKYDCKPGLFGDDVFAAPTEKVCDMDQLLSSIMGGTAGGNGANGMPSPCDQIGDATKNAACKAACDPLGSYMDKAQCAAAYYQ